MSAVICTLFEGNYHYGVAALTNSLFKNQFRGDIYAGYKGMLPDWASSAKENISLNWPSAKSLAIAADFQLHFLPVNTDYHLTNYKPDFMLKVWDGIVSETKTLFYFDPDIIVCAPWTFFQNWVECGVALCEDVNSPLEEFHPRRVAWRNYFGTKGLELQFKNNIYVNAGFIGVSLRNIEFITKWKLVQEAMAFVIGGLDCSAFNNGKPLPIEAQNSFSPFNRTDQDALNATIEVWQGKLSFIGKEAMAFKDGTAILPHALGQPKPWQWKPLFQVIQGHPPRLVDRKYWSCVDRPLKTHPANLVKYRNFLLSFASLIGRFYSRN